MADAGADPDACSSFESTYNGSFGLRLGGLFIILAVRPTAYPLYRLIILISRRLPSPRRFMHITDFHHRNIIPNRSKKSSKTFHPSYRL